MSAAGIPLSALGLHAAAPVQTVIDEIRSELAVIILENRSEIRKKLMAAEADPARVLTGFMFRRLMDRARWSPRNDPFRYLYKMAADALREADGIHLSTKGSTGSLYSLEKESRPIGPLCEEDYTTIPLPADLPRISSLAEVTHKKTLVRLARWFWQEMSRLFQNRPIWIELRDLIQWIAVYIPLGRVETRLPDTHKDGTESDNLPAVEPDRNAPFDPEVVCRWAGCFSNLLNDKEAMAFYLYHGEERPLKDVAIRMGFKGPSGPAVHLGSVTEKLSAFAADLRWLSPDKETPPNRLAQRLFKETLTEILKKRFETP
ncbi:hypothetical protein [Desulfococcus sp.]|uniref:hypothetical protein n=1 Tax=Desulfococcus sp. TaxID=2025834 RepID=UPI003593125A